MTSKHQIGDDVWWSRFESVEEWIPCPDCGGTKYITITLFDGSIHTIDCDNCRRGYEGPRGSILTYVYQPTAVQTTINGVRIDSSKTEYSVPGSYVVDECDLHKTKDEALSRAEERAVEFTIAERAKLGRKERDTKTWSWHVSYHRGAIRRMEKDIARHTARLIVAKQNVEPKKRRAT